MMSEEQRLERMRKMLMILGAMNTGCKSIKEVSEETLIPTSTIQRYLNNLDLYNELASNGFIPHEKIKDHLEFSKKWLTEAKKTGVSKGGTVSQALYGFSKDGEGKFTGRGK